MALRARRGKRGREEEVLLDSEKTAAENVLQVLVNICRRSGGVADTKKVSYLQALVGLLQDMATKDTSTDLGLRVKEIMLCLRIPLTCPSGDVRAGTLRALRYLVRSQLDVMAVTGVNMHLLLARILDLDLDNNRGERVQAVRLARKMLMFGSSCFPSSLVKCLLAIVQRGGKEKSRDELWRVSLAVLCELSCLNPDLFLSTGCVRILSTALLDCGSMPRVSEAVVGCLMRLYSIPSCRERAGLDLSIVVAPFTELHYVHSGLGKSEDSRTECGATALLSLVRSWPGLLHLSCPQLHTRPLQSLLDILYLPSYETRRTILDLLYQSLSLQVPDWTDEFEVAMRTADPSAVKDTWKLTDGFVAAEGRDLLPHLARSRPNLVENHTAVLLSCYLQCGLPAALICVIVTSDTVLSVRAAVLLGQFLHLVSTLLPHEIAATQNCLPLLASHIYTAGPDFSKQESNRALAAITALQKLHALKRRGCLPNSLILEQVLEYSGHHQGSGWLGDRLKLPSSCPVTDQTADVNNIKESGVVAQRDPQSWKWELILSALKWPSEALRKLEDSTCRLFLKKVTDFYLPSSNMFSRLELDSSRTRYLARVGQALLDFLLSSIPVGSVQADPEASQRIDTLLSDIMTCVEEVIQSSSPHDCVFSPTRLINTACQLYFLFLGRLSRTETGRNCLDRHKTLSLLTELLKVRHDIYLKLVVSCMDYRQDDWGSRTHLLTKALTAAPEYGRVYATRWVGVLARVGVPSIAVYGVELLVKQLKDESLTVASTALTILDEVCDDKMFLESLVSNSSLLLSTTGRAALDMLGDRGRLLLTRCVGSATGLSLMSSNSWLVGELAYWATTFNTRYVLLLETLISDGFSLHQRSEDGYGTYGRRTGDGHTIRDVFVPPHLYGQLAQTRPGLELLLGESSFWSMVVRLQELEMGTGLDTGGEEDWLEAKAAIWGVAHVATSPTASLLLEQRGVITTLVNIAEQCPVLSIKGTAYYAMGLVATTRPGSTALGGKGWVTIRHGRGEHWPIATDWLGASDNMFPVSPSHLAPSPAQSEAWLDETCGTEQQQPAIRGQTVESKTGNRRDTDRESDTGTVRPSPGKISTKFSDKVSSWFRNSVDNGKSESSSNGQSSKSGRRNSEGSKGSSSGLAHKLRQSFRERRHRPRTVSAGSLPSKDNTPSGSCNDQSDLEPLEVKFKRKLSFSGDEPDGDVDRPVQASPGDTLPGEMFQLDNIVEEPENQKNAQHSGLPRPSMSTSSSGLSSGSTRQATAPAQKLSPISSEPSMVQMEMDHATSQAINIGGQAVDIEAITPSGQSVGSCRSVPQLEQVDHSIVSIECDGSLEEPPPPSLADIPSEGTRGEGTLLGVIRQGTSVSSVSSIGSYTFQENPGYSSRHSRRRPQLSESEDGDPVVGPRPGLARQDSYSRNTFPIRGRHKPHPVLDTGRSVSVPPKIYGTLPRSDHSKEPSYWGLAYPLSHTVLYPSDSPPTTCPLSSLPGALGSLFQSSPSHNPTHCLGCYKLQVSARPRAASLTSANNSKISITSSSSLPGSHQSPATNRRSWVETTQTDSTQTRPDHGNISPTGHKEAVVEAMDLICAMNNSVKSKQAEASLVKLQRKWPAIFADLCFYSDVSNILGVYSFRLASRKFIQELFLGVQFSKMDDEAMHVLGLAVTK